MRNEWVNTLCFGYFCILKDWVYRQWYSHLDVQSQSQTMLHFSSYLRLFPFVTGWKLWVCHWEAFWEEHQYHPPKTDGKILSLKNLQSAAVLPEPQRQFNVKVCDIREWKAHDTSDFTIAVMWSGALKKKDAFKQLFYYVLYCCIELSVSPHACTDILMFYPLGFNTYT